MGRRSQNTVLPREKNLKNRHTQPQQSTIERNEKGTDVFSMRREVFKLHIRYPKHEILYRTKELTKHLNLEINKEL